MGGRQWRSAPAREKAQLRRQVLDKRARLSGNDLERVAESLSDVLLAVPEVGRAAVVAAYLGVGSEPGTRPLLNELHRRDIQVLLPVMRKDYDLDWAVYDLADTFAPGPLGVREPTGQRLGLTAVSSADAVLVPGVAADRTGLRLGRGGGCYDRVLPRLAPEAFSCVLLHDGEVMDTPLPREPHDQSVRAAATPSGLLRFS